MESHGLARGHPCTRHAVEVAHGDEEPHIAHVGATLYCREDQITFGVIVAAVACR
jgi:hypothetical protein